MSTSCKPVINNRYIKKDGTSAVYLRIIINGRCREIKLDIHWPVNKWDESNFCLPLSKQDTTYHDNNILIRSAVSKANDIFIYFRLRSLKIDLPLFLKEYKTNLTKADFIEYMVKKSRQRLVNKEIEESTYKAHKKTIAKLKMFRDWIPFSSLYGDWAKDFEAFLKQNITSKTSGVNTRWAHHKTVKAYLKLAIIDHISFEDPYVNYKVPQTQGHWRPIFEKEFIQLLNYYRRPDIPRNQKRVLRTFLFSCMTGLRISDLNEVRYEWNANGIISFVQRKNRKKGKITKVPLNLIARELWDDAIQDRTRLLPLFRITEQPGNRLLTKIGIRLGIKNPLHFHVGRHTFASIYYQKTKDIFLTKEFMGHWSITQTQKYVHKDEREMHRAMERMNGIGN